MSALETGLDHGWTSRGLGMGGAFSSVANTAEAVYWNPAGLSRLSRQSLDSTFAKSFNEVNETAVFYAFPAGESWALGAGFTRAEVGDIAGYDQSGNSTGTFAYREQVLYASAANQWNAHWAWGGTLKFLSRQALATQSGLLWDAGLLYTLDHQRIAFVLENGFGSTMGIDSIAPSYRLGISSDTAVGILSADLRYKNSGFLFYGGVEYPLTSQLAVRAGISNGKFNVGLGLNWAMVSVDYVYAGSDLDAAHRFSLGCLL